MHHKLWLSRSLVPISTHESILSPKGDQSENVHTPGMVTLPVISALRSLRQGKHHMYKANLGYIVRPCLPESQTERAWMLVNVLLNMGFVVHVHN